MLPWKSLVLDTRRGSFKEILRSIFLAEFSIRLVPILFDSREIFPSISGGRDHQKSSFHHLTLPVSKRCEIDKFNAILFISPEVGISIVQYRESLLGSSHCESNSRSQVYCNPYCDVNLSHFIPHTRVILFGLEMISRGRKYRREKNIYPIAYFFVEIVAVYAFLITFKCKHNSRAFYHWIFQDVMYSQRVLYDVTCFPRDSKKYSHNKPLIRPKSTAWVWRDILLLYGRYFQVSDPKIVPLNGTARLLKTTVKASELPRLTGLSSRLDCSWIDSAVFPPISSSFILSTPLFTLLFTLC